MRSAKQIASCLYNRISEPGHNVILDVVVLVLLSIMVRQDRQAKADAFALRIQAPGARVVALRLVSCFLLT